MWPNLRTVLFVPGDRQERFAKAAQAGADAIVLDLEDAVLPAAKEAARERVYQWCQAHRDTIVRVNGAATPWFADDLAMLKQAGVTAVMLPKAETTEQLQQLCTVLGPDVQLFPVLETVQGVYRARELAQCPQVARLVFGSVDFAVDSGIADESGWLPVQIEMVLASRLAAIAPPIDGVVLSWDDEALLLRAGEQSKKLGFGGRLCIHPQQLRPIRQGFSPTQAELVWAKKVVDALAQTQGAVVVDGKLVDEPIRRMATRLLEQAQG